MNHALQIRFDEVTEKAIQSIWRSAAYMYGTEYLFKVGALPHMTLLVGDSTLGEVFTEIECAPFGIQLFDTGFFGNGSVVYMHCHISDQLIEFHSQIYKMAIARGARVDDLYAPAIWVPHCTIAADCSRNLMDPIVIPEMTAIARSLIHITYPPTKLVVEKPVLTK